MKYVHCGFMFFTTIVSVGVSLYFLYQGDRFLSISSMLIAVCMTMLTEFMWSNWELLEEESK